MAESRFAIAELEAEMAAELTLQALAARHEVDSRHRENETETETDTGAEAELQPRVEAQPEPRPAPPADIDIDPWRPLFEGD